VGFKISIRKLNIIGISQEQTLKETKRTSNIRTSRGGVPSLTMNQNKLVEREIFVILVNEHYNVECLVTLRHGDPIETSNTAPRVVPVKRLCEIRSERLYITSLSFQTAPVLPITPKEVFKIGSQWRSITRRLNKRYLDLSLFLR